MIEAAMKDREVCGSGFLYIVVMDPGLFPEDADFAGAVLVEHAVGDRTQWDADYAGDGYVPRLLDIRTLSDAIAVAALLDRTAGRADEASRKTAAGFAVAAWVGFHG